MQFTLAIAALHSVSVAQAKAPRDFLARSETEAAASGWVTARTSAGTSWKNCMKLRPVA